MRLVVLRTVIFTLLATLGAVVALSAREHAGRVTFASVPVPGATVTATQGDQRHTTVTNGDGVYQFGNLADGLWTIEVAMVGFAGARVDVTVGEDATAASIALTARPFAEIARDAVRAETVVAGAPAFAEATAGRPTAPAGPSAPAALPSAPADPLMDTADGLLVNGSVNNGASSPFAQAAAFGNNRSGRRSLYNGSMGAVFGSSAWDARPYSFDSVSGPKPSYGDLQFLGTFGGPMRIPGLVNRPNIFVGYQRSTDHSAATQTGIVPTNAERVGDFSQSGVQLRDPATGAPFAGNRIPANRLSAAALSLMAYYPLANLDPGGSSNFQAPTLTAAEQNNLQARFTHAINTRNSLTGTFAMTDADANTTSLLGFTDRIGTGSIDATVVWSRRFSPFFSSRVRYQFQRTATDARPHFANLTNVSGIAGINGTDQSPDNWGPPSLSFANGMLSMSSVQFEETRANSHGAGFEGLWNRPGHSITAGAGMRWVDLVARGQQNGRGSFTFTGAGTGSPLADFLLGLPQASALAYGNPEKLLNAASYEAYITDDWRVTPGLTINAGLRWDFEMPFTEEQGRLSNLALTSDFTSSALVTGQNSQSVLKSDARGLQPRVGIAWRPVAGSSLVVRAGYGIYRNTNVYRPLALLMAQQPPFSTALSLERSPATPITLTDGFIPSAAGAQTTFAIDPNFRVSDAQNWQALAQRDLPGSLTMSVAYLGAYGRHLMQEVLPNTYPAGSTNPCLSCPYGFAYLTSNGSSVRHAGQFQLRRRLRNGFTASAQYTIATATDDAGAFTGAALTGSAIAQDWRDPEADRGPSNFDQRHLFVGEIQYTTGVGVTGGGLLTGVRGALVKGWTFMSRVTAGSGLPLTPVYLAPVSGTGVTGSLRATLTGAPLDAIPSGLYFNPDAFAAPEAGTWGDAGRNSLRGPAQFEMTAGVTRSFAWTERLTLDWRLDATNVLNRVTYSTVNTIAGSPQFGAPTRANPMRKLQTTIRLRF